MSLTSSPTDPQSPAVGDPFRHRLRVRYGECDPQGIVFNANYLLYFDVVFTELWRAAIGPWQEMVERGVDAVVAEASLEFRAPARFDDVLTLSAQVTRLGRTAITTDIDALRGEDLLVHGRLRHVCVSTETWRKTDMPDWVRSGLRRFASPDAESDDARE
jgi:acyl-CoA thioester hydrolase